MSGRLQGKLTLVTGGNTGIGAGIVREFAREGARVLIHGRYRADEQASIDKLVSAGVSRENLAYRGAELMDGSQCLALVEFAAGIFGGGLDILVNNAGDFRRGNIETTTLQLWDEQFAVNVRAAFILTQATLPLMRRRGGGSIVNIGSINEYVGLPNLLAYSSAKGALSTFTRNAAQQVNVMNIRVNQVNPGWTLTEAEDGIQRAETGRDDWIREALNTRPFGRLLEPLDIAMAALYFASDDSAAITGSVMDAEQYPSTNPDGWYRKVR
jgi:NAD(P)-dependent dehydrogenase (short-subunit alcohol dehydrogenase family)